jgi:PEP-CTERM motif
MAFREQRRHSFFFLCSELATALLAGNLYGGSRHKRCVRRRARLRACRDCDAVDDYCASARLLECARTDRGDEFVPTCRACLQASGRQSGRQQENRAKRPQIRVGPQFALSSGRAVFRVNVMSRRRLWLLLILVPGLLGLGAFATVWQRSGAASEEPEQMLSGPQVLPEVEVESAAPRRGGSAPALPSVPTEPQSAPAATQSAPPAVSETPQDSGEVSGPPQFAQDAGIAVGGDDPGIVRLASLRGASFSGYLSDSTSRPGSGGANVPGSKSQPDGANTGEGPNASAPDRTGEEGTPPQVPPPQDDPPREEPLPDPTPDDDDPPYYPPGDDEPHEPVQVPEPATLGLLVLGLLGCAVRRRAS